MPYVSRSKSTKARRPGPPPPPLIEARLTIPDALLAWANDNDRQIAWARPYGRDVAELLERAPLGLADTEALLSRLDAIVSAALAEGRSDLLVGFDLQSAEWLGLHVHVETKNGPMHVGPDPQTRPFPNAIEPPWTYSEVRVIYDAKRERPDMTIDHLFAVKAALHEVFLGARIDGFESEQVERVCLACGKPVSSVMMRTVSGDEYHSKCWSEMTSPLPEHLRELLRKTPKAKHK